MAKRRLIHIFIFIIGFYGMGISQQSNPFELKSRKSIQQKPVEKDENVFNIDVENEEVLPQSNSQNPFELDKKKNNKKQSVNKSGGAKIEVKQKEKVDLGAKYHGDSKFLLWLFLFMLVFLALLLSVNRGLVMKIVKVIWYYNHTNLLFRNFGNREMVFYIFLFINFIINMAIFLYLLIEKNTQFNGLSFFLKVVSIVFVIYLIKHISIMIFRNSFKSLKSLSVYNFTILLFNISLGLFLIPINLLGAYSLTSISSFFIGFGIVLIIVLYVLRLLRGFLITYDYFNISIFHFFLYLCAFEILPLLILSKYFADFL